MCSSDLELEIKAAHAAMRSDYVEWARQNPYNCRRQQRFGGDGDGGKWVCVGGMPPRAAEPCLILSVGSGHDFSWESAMHDRWPRCSIHVFDGTNFGWGAPPKVPRFVRFHAENFEAHPTNEMRRTLAGASRVDVLKIDVRLFRPTDRTPRAPAATLSTPVGSARGASTTRWCPSCSACEWCRSSWRCTAACNTAARRT